MPILIYLVRDHLPLQQGLRLSISTVRVAPSIVRDHLPLQQGLRLPVSALRITFAVTVRDHLPLQQGLRQYSHCLRGLSSHQYETIFHYNKD